MQKLKYKNVIVGSGFAGRTVASYLDDASFIILERGEDRPFSEILKRYGQVVHQNSSQIESEKYAYRSNLPWNVMPVLSRWNYSQFAMIRGGSSNWWGGKATRFSREVFDDKTFLPWRLSYEDMLPWYEKAEHRLNICGDPLNAASPARTYMPGAEYWRDAFKPYFQNTFLYNVALNKNLESKTSQGFCKGRANCAMCKEDAKARPDNIFSEQNILFEAMVLEIIFDGEKAIAVECYDGKQVFQIEFEQIILACNGIETPRLLHRSNLPDQVRRSSIGSYYQDHAHLQISCKINKKILYGNAGGLSHIVIEEISGMYDTSIGNIEVSALAITHEPNAKTFELGMDINLLRNGGSKAFLEDISGCFDIFCELEIPPQLNLKVDLESEEPKIIDDAYEKLIPIFDGVVSSLLKKLTITGVEVLNVNRFYQNGYGGHHFCGTTNFSNTELAVVDENLKLIGSQNVYVVGAGVIPRAGGVAPTLTLVALAERLGTHLASNL